VADTITILGAGNGGCAAAADLSLGGWEVTLYNRTDARLQPFRERGGIVFHDPEDRGVVAIHELTSDLGAALRASDRLVVMVPTTTLGYYAEAMAPHLTPAHKVLVAPGHTGGAMFFSRRVATELGECPCKVGEAHTLPYICRMTAPAEVTLWKRSEHLLFAALPASDTSKLLDMFAVAFKALAPASSVLETSLSNLNAVMHPGAMLLNAGWIEETGGGFNFYSEGTTPAVARVIAATDSERVAIGATLGLELPSFLEVFYKSGYSTEAAWESGDFYKAIRESPPNRLIRSPASLQHRYVREDIGYGLVPMAAFAAAAGAEVPIIDALVKLAGVAIGEDLAEGGLNAGRMGIEGLDAEGLCRYALDGPG